MIAAFKGIAAIMIGWGIILLAIFRPDIFSGLVIGIFAMILWLGFDANQQAEAKMNRPLSYEHKAEVEAMAADLKEHWRHWLWRELPAHRYMIKALAWALIQRGWRRDASSRSKGVGYESQQTHGPETVAPESRSRWPLE